MDTFWATFVSIGKLFIPTSGRTDWQRACGLESSGRMIHFVARMNNSFAEYKTGSTHYYLYGIVVKIAGRLQCDQIGRFIGLKANF